MPGVLSSSYFFLTFPIFARLQQKIVWALYSIPCCTLMVLDLPLPPQQVLEMAVSGHSLRAVQFGPYEVDRQSGDLLKDGQRIRLQIKPFQILLLLLEKHGDLVSREELQKALWPGDTFVDFDNSLNAAMKKLRDALGDSPDQPRYIETLHRRGYRFIASVTAPNGSGEAGLPESMDIGRNASARNVAAHTASPKTIEEAESHPHSTQAPHLTFSRPTSLTARAALAIAFVLLAALTFRIYSKIAHRGLGSVAVLPFLNLSPDPANQYLGDGVTEELTTAFGQLPQLRVAARTSAFQFHDGAGDVRQIGKRLNVATVLEGSVSASGDTLRITAQLINAHDGYHMWSRAYDGTRSDLQVLQRSIFHDAAEALRLTVPDDVQRRLSARDTTNSQAHDLFLQARYLWNQRIHRNKLEQSIALLRKAIEMDPNYALAYSALADDYAVRAVNDGSADPAPLAKTAVKKALQLDPTLGEPYAALGLMESQVDWNFSQAEQDFQRAIALAPDYAPGHQWRGQNLTILERFAEAEQELRRAQLLDPTSLIITEGLAENFYYWRRGDEALEQARSMLALEPQHPSAVHMMGMVYTQKRMYAQAIACNESLGSDPYIFVWKEEGIGATYAAAGDRQNALRVAAELETHSAPATEIAFIYAGLGDKEKALSWLEAGYGRHDPELVHLKLDPRFDNLRDNPRYRALVKKIFVN